MARRDARVSAKPYPGRWWHLLDDGRMQCDLCPRDCRLHEGQRGACFVRMREADEMVLTTYGLVRLTSRAGASTQLGTTTDGMPRRAK